MEYVYAAMLLHSAENEINEKNVNAVLKSAGVKADGARVKALCASLEGVDIGEAMTSAVAAPAAAAPTDRGRAYRDRSADGSDSRCRAIDEVGTGQRGADGPLGDSRASWAAASLAMGTRYGEQLT